MKISDVFSNDSIPVDKALLQAIELHKAGNLQEAERVYRAILDVAPKHPDANHNLGVLAVQVNQASAGLPYFNTALEANPNSDQYWLSYIDALIRSGQQEAARQVLAQGRQRGLQGEALETLARQMTPTLPAAPRTELRTVDFLPSKQNTLYRETSQEESAGEGEIDTLVTLFSEGRYSEAEHLARKMTERFPRHGFGWKGLGAALKSQGRIAESLEPMKIAATLLPGDAEAHCNLGNTLRDAGCLKEAEASYRWALEIQPDYAEAHNNLGNTLNDLGRLSEAEVCYHQALKIRPDYAIAYNNLGKILNDLGRLAEAEVCCRRALEIIQDYAGAHNNLGIILKQMGRLEEAVVSYRKALEIQPDFAEASFNLGNSLNGLSRLIEAEASYRRALELKPDYAEAHQCLSSVLARLSDFSQVVAESDAALRLKPNDATIWEQRLYAFSYHPDLSVEDIYAEFVRWGDRYSNPAVDFSSHDRNPGRRLRVGYVSPDFRRHTSRFYFWPLFANHDHTVVELFAYSNVSQEDNYTEQFKGLFDHWRNIHGVADSDVAQMVREDRIDILVDGCNHMLDTRLGIFALKPAPVQVTWLGACWTTGLKAVDYVLFDPYMAPEGTLARENIVRLPNFFVAYNPPKENAEIVAPPCLKNGFITFGYSGRSERLSHRTFRAWGEILRQTPTAQLILDFGPFADPPTQVHYQKLMARYGVDIGRVVMRNSANIFEGLNDFDILLDCFPHSGGTMLFDALWMGVPALTMACRPPLGRIGTSLMMNLDLPEWVALNEDDYIAKACNFAGNPDELVALRAGMRERMRLSPVMDGAGFANAVEAAYLGMFDRWRGENQ